MEQVANELQKLDRNASCRDADKKRSRPLTYDEKKAAEAAFQGTSFNPAWSQAAMQVYEGVFAAMTRMGVMRITPLQEDSQ
jgi:hypothetical protein